MKKKDYCLKKTKNLNKNKQIIGFLDQTFCDKNAPPNILSKRNRKKLV